MAQYNSGFTDFVPSGYRMLSFFDEKRNKKISVDVSLIVKFFKLNDTQSVVVFYEANKTRAIAIPYTLKQIAAVFTAGETV